MNAAIVNIVCPVLIVSSFAPCHYAMLFIKIHATGNGRETTEVGVF